MNRIVKTFFVTVAVVMLTGCNLYKKYELPVGDDPIVADFSKAVEAQVDSTSLPFLSWEEVFTDPLLQNLIRRALENNKDLDNARLNVEMARAQLKGAKLSYFPSAALNFSGSSASYNHSPMSWTYQLPLALNWEIDAFGKILNRKRGAEVSLEQSQAYEQAVRSQIICGIANVYYSLVLLNQQLDLTRRTADIWKEQVDAMVLMKEAARVNEAAVVQSRANYYNVLSTIPDLERQIHVTQNSLSLLLNTYPQTWEVTTSLDFNLPDNLTTGIPITYLAVRPDVKAAERGFAAAYYATNAARANFYPSLSISSNGGFTNLLGSFVTNPGKWFIQLAGSLVAPLFSRGTNIAALEAAKAQQQIALNNFQYAVLNASAEVSDALVELNKNAEKRVYVLQQIDQLEKSVEYTQELLTLGQGTYLEVLTARSALLQSQLSSLACWHARATALVSLYQAVGGGR